MTDPNPNNSERNLTIPAEVHSDDWVYEAKFDALPWFQQASDDEIKALADIDWGGNHEADEVARFCDDDADVKAVFDYLDHRQDQGYECHVDGDKALAWFKDNKPDLWWAMQQDDLARMHEEESDTTEIVEPRFRNFYKCPRCGHQWQDDWDSTCDDDCPKCGCRHISPDHSEDL